MYGIDREDLIGRSGAGVTINILPNSGKLINSTDDDHTITYGDVTDRNRDPDFLSHIYYNRTVVGDIHRHTNPLDPTDHYYLIHLEEYYRGLVRVYALNERDACAQIVEIAARDIIDHLDNSLNDIVRGVNNHYDHINYLHKETTNLSNGRIDTLNENLTERITHLRGLFKWVIGGQLTISGVLLLLILLRLLA